MIVRGWVYVITNRAMPGLYKVGFSTKDPLLRAEELGHTGSPHPYIVIYDALVENPRDIEQAAHRLLNEKREGKEWFRCSANEAIGAIKKIASTILLERFTSEADKVNNDSNIEQKSGYFNKLCYYYGCQEEATRDYKGILYCNKHYWIARSNPGRNESIARIRQELQDEWKKRES